MKPMADQLFLSEEHRIFRTQVRKFVQTHLSPNVDQWERDKTFPREVYQKMGESGLLGVGIPEAYGGSGGDLFHSTILAEELTRSGSSGLGASLGTISIAMPPVLIAGTETQKTTWLPKVCSGQWISALAVTEPGAGSDVASVRTRAVRDGDHYIVNGAKTFITSGTRADIITTVVRTGGDGFGGISLLAIEPDPPGFHVSRHLAKLGWPASDTAELAFEDLRVPVENLIGPENGGFGILMQNFATERLTLAITAVEMAQMAYEESLKYTRQRQAFGRPLTGFQVTRHKLAEMATGIDLCRTYNYALASQIVAGQSPIKEVAMAKNASTDMACRVIDQAVQLHGGFGYMREYLVERLYRDIRIFPIGGGTREIMNEIISKTLG